MKKYLGYIRVSTVRQGEHGSSLVEQRASIEAYAKRHDLNVTAWFEEMETAAKRGRRIFNKMIAQLKKGGHAGVIIHKIDRSARNLRDWASIGELIDQGLEVHFTHESLDLTSRGGRLAADIQAVVAADYVRNLRDEVLKGFYGRLKQGFYPLPAPIGYLDRGKARFKEIDPLKGPLIRLAFELYATGRYSMLKLSDELYARGLEAETAGPLSVGSMAQILHNHFYYGLIRIRRTGETFEGGHEPLVSKSLFDQVRRVIDGRGVVTRTPNSFTYRKLITCQQCNKFLVGEFHKGNVYYRCHDKVCRQPSLREDRLEHTIFRTLENLHLGADELTDLRACAEAYQSEAEKQRAARREQAARDLALIEDRLNRLTDAFVDGAIEREAYLARKEALTVQRASLRELKATGGNVGGVDKTAAMLQVAAEAQLKFPDATAEEKRVFLQSLCTKLSALDGAFEMDLRFPFDRIADSTHPA